MKIGSAYCDVTAASATELTCTLGSGALGMCKYHTMMHQFGIPQHTQLMIEFREFDIKKLYISCGLIVKKAVTHVCQDEYRVTLCYLVLIRSWLLKSRDNRIMSGLSMLYYIHVFLSSGTFEIEVYTPDGLADGSDNFTYDVASVDAISPSSGSVAGGCPNTNRVHYKILILILLHDFRE